MFQPMCVPSSSLENTVMWGCIVCGIIGGLFLTLINIKIQKKINAAALPANATWLAFGCLSPVLTGGFVLWLLGTVLFPKDHDCGVNENLLGLHGLISFAPSMLLSFWAASFVLFAMTRK